MAQFIEVFPARNNVGKDAITPQRMPENLAKKMVKTGLWSYTPVANTQDDISLMVNQAKGEIAQEMRNINEEKERMRLEREDLEALRVQLLTGEPKKAGRPAKTEV